MRVRLNLHIVMPAVERKWHKMCEQSSSSKMIRDFCEVPRGTVLALISELNITSGTKN